MIYGYARVSSAGQAKDGNSLEAQGTALRERGCQEIFSEAYTGVTMDRPIFTKLMQMLRSGDTLMVTKLDRFSRSAAGGVTVIRELFERGVSVEILNMGRADNTVTGRLMLNILLAFAEFEHDGIVERLNEGKAVAKSHGKKTDGRYKKEVPEFQKFLKQKKDGQITVQQGCEILGISRSKWYKLEREVA